MELELVSIPLSLIALTAAIVAWLRSVQTEGQVDELELFLGQELEDGALTSGEGCGFRDGHEWHDAPYVISDGTAVYKCRHCPSTLRHRMKVEE
jgi:hypothetical protein